MTPQTPRFKGVLFKSMHLGAAKTRGLLAAQLGANPSTDDKVAYLIEEIGKRWVEIDKVFQLETSSANIWELRVKALISRKFGIGSEDPRWWERLAVSLARLDVPGFSIKGENEPKHGAPIEWTIKNLCGLFADIEFLKKTYGGTVREICEILRYRKGYAQRWRRYRLPALCRAYSRAGKLRLTSVEFLLTLYGGELKPGLTETDRIDAAIRLHALQI